MKILFAASEAVPFIKTGGLGEVVGALSAALKSAGHDVRLVLPKYRGMGKDIPPLAKLPLDLKISIGNDEIPIQVFEAVFSPRLKAYLVDSPAFFDRDGIYGDPHGGEFSDNDRRYILLSQAVFKITKAVGFRPDVVHAHDWQTGLVPVYLATQYRSDPFFNACPSVFTVHNIAYQGIFPKETLGTAHLAWTEFTADKLEFYDQVNFLKGGLAYAQVISTVSPTYSLETQRESFGVGLDGFLKRRASDYFGILNGLDTRYWNPQKDPHLTRPYSSKKWGPRAACREDLQRTAGLELDSRAPILGMVSRLDVQKGFDILLDILDDFIGNGCQAVFLGMGSPVYQAALRTLQRKYPGRMSVTTDFNEPLAHKIYGGSDIFLMPSRFEPCGLGQMIALRYGAVPVVTPTGGLKDTVDPVTADGIGGVGFVADRTDTDAYRFALQRAVRLFREKPDTWHALVQRGMGLSFDWKNSVQRYLDLYQLAQSKKRLAKGR